MKLVQWEIDSERSNPIDAAIESFIRVRRRNSIANTFDVVDGDGETQRVDLQEMMDEDKCIRDRYLEIANETPEYYALILDRIGGATVHGAFDGMKECDETIQRLSSDKSLVTVIVLEITSAQLRVREMRAVGMTQ